MTEQALYEHALTLLAKRDYSSGELKRQLLRLASVEEVGSVMETLLSHHYVDDSRLIEREIQKQLAKPHGEAHTKQALRKKGLDNLLVAQALEDLDVDWFELCLQAKEKKYGTERPKRRQRKNADGSPFAISWPFDECHYRSAVSLGGAFKPNEHIMTKCHCYYEVLLSLWSILKKGSSNVWRWKIQHTASVANGSPSGIGQVIRDNENGSPIFKRRPS
ncbi:Regulatory protein RecX (modular protein) [Vibrio owensii]|uniref:Regulatory protein RecX n=1 Tax=Vibrio owensii TaxID=696485 RepID=A0AAU9Q9X8_9VIBR|nr:Regulatory protein RecX (modular protein) [Vibrio owensii]